MYSQIVDVLERLGGVEIHVSEEIKQSALNIKYLLNRDDMDDTMDDDETTFAIKKSSWRAIRFQYDEDNCMSLPSQQRLPFCFTRIPNVTPSEYNQKLLCTLGYPGEITDCENTLKQVFSKLTDKEQYCKVIVDKIHIKPSVRY